MAKGKALCQDWEGNSRQICWWHWTRYVCLKFCVPYNECVHRLILQQFVYRKKALRKWKAKVWFYSYELTNWFWFCMCCVYTEDENDSEPDSERGGRRRLRNRNNRNVSFRSRSRSRSRERNGNGVSERRRRSRWAVIKTYNVYCILFTVYCIKLSLITKWFLLFSFVFFMFFLFGTKCSSSKAGNLVSLHFFHKSAVCLLFCSRCAKWPS